MTNTLDYYDTELITVVKSFYCAGLWLNIWERKLSKNKKIIFENYLIKLDSISYALGGSYLFEIRSAEFRETAPTVLFLTKSVRWERVLVLKVGMFFYRWQTEKIIPGPPTAMY